MHIQAEPVLVDVTGLRARRLRRIGRVVGALFTLWFCGLVLAGLGLIPSDQLPLGSALLPATAPPSLSSTPPATPTRAADLRPATALADQPGTSPSGQRGSAGPSTPRRPDTTGGKAPSGHSPASSPPSLPGTGTGRSTFPGAGPASKGKSTTAPGHTKTGTTPAATPPAKSKTPAAPTTAPGSSGSAPGHDTTSPGNGQGNGPTRTTP
jgi:hypothetical protein